MLLPLRGSIDGGRGDVSEAKGPSLPSLEPLRRGFRIVVLVRSRGTEEGVRVDL